MNTLGHFDSLGNAYFQYLEGANKAHMTARAKYQQLTKLLKDKGVKFAHIKNFLLNEAKRAGLYRKNHYDDKKGEMVYPPLSKLTHLAWYASVSNYITWLKANFVDYGVNKPKAKKTKKTSKVVVRKSKGGDVKKAEIVSKDGITEGKEIDQIVEELSPKQIQSILEDNWGILGQFCKAKGATEEFNLLMDKLGYEEEQIG